MKSHEKEELLRAAYLLQLIVNGHVEISYMTLIKTVYGILNQLLEENNAQTH